MSITPPEIVLRLGSHAEKEYLINLAGNYDGIMFGANLLEITPTATASLLALLRNRISAKAGADGFLRYYLDPMTYCFGAYIDPVTGKKRIDLDALKSTRKDRKTKESFYAIKDSYMSLATALGPAFSKAVNDGNTGEAIEPSEIPIDERDTFCKSVLHYQMNRISDIIKAALPENDEILQQLFEGIREPAAVFAPYFFVHSDWADDGLSSMIDLIARSVAQEPNLPVHAVVCASGFLLQSDNHLQFLIKNLPLTGVAGVWLWFDGFDELGASIEELKAFRKLVTALSSRMKVYNLHGGYFSLLLAHEGLTGISHGVGYGERKDIAQMIGAAAPTVRYYLPSIKKRVGVPDIQRCLPDIGIRNAQDFFDNVCDCVICKGVIGNDIANFGTFGQMHRAKEDSKKDTQTPTAAKACRFHFLIRRLQERQVVAELDAAERSGHLKASAAPWRGCYPLIQHLGKEKEEGYIELWAEALST